MPLWMVDIQCLRVVCLAIANLFFVVFLLLLSQTGFYPF